MKRLRAVMPWAFDVEISRTVRAAMWYPFIYLTLVILFPATSWWARTLTVVILNANVLGAYFTAYWAGSDRGRGRASAPSPPMILVPWDDAAIIEDVEGKLRVHLLAGNALAASDEELVVNGARVRWRGKLPSRELREVDRFTTELCTRRPWESRQ